MSDYRINVRFHTDVPAEKNAAEYLQALNKSRNKFIVDAVIAYMNKESADNELCLKAYGRYLGKKSKRWRWWQRRLPQ